MIQRQILANVDSDDDLFLPDPQEETSRSLPGSWSDTPPPPPEFGDPGLDKLDANSPLPTSNGAVTGGGYLGYGAPSVSNLYGSSSSIVDGLLLEIYDRWQYPQRDSLDSDTFTECSSTSDAFYGRSDSVQLDFGAQRHSARFNRIFLEGKGRDSIQIKNFKHLVSHLLLL